MNTLVVVARGGKEVVRDSVNFTYQTEKWGKPAKMATDVVGHQEDTALLRVRFVDANGVACLDAANWGDWGVGGGGKGGGEVGGARGERGGEAVYGGAVVPGW